MIKTKNQIIVNSRTGEVDTVYFDAPFYNHDEVNNQVSYALVLFRMNGGGLLVEFDRITCVYKMATFITIMNGVNFSTYAVEKNRLMKEQIAHNGSDFWGLTVADLEDYVPA